MVLSVFQGLEQIHRIFVTIVNEFSKNIVLQSHEKQVALPFFVSLTMSTTHASTTDFARGFNPAQDGPIVAVAVILGVAALAGIVYITWAVRRTRHLAALRQRRVVKENIYDSFRLKQNEPEDNIYETINHFRPAEESRFPANDAENPDVSQVTTVEIRSRNSSSADSEVNCGFVECYN